MVTEYAWRIGRHIACRLVAGSLAEGKADLLCFFVYLVMWSLWRVPCSRRKRCFISSIALLVFIDSQNLVDLIPSRKVWSNPEALALAQRRARATLQWEVVRNELTLLGFSWVRYALTFMFPPIHLFAKDSLNSLKPRHEKWAVVLGATLDEFTAHSIQVSMRSLLKKTAKAISKGKHDKTALCLVFLVRLAPLANDSETSKLRALATELKYAKLRAYLSTFEEEDD